MPTILLPRFMQTYETKIAHTKKLEQIARETNGNLTTERLRYYAYTAADSLTLRGIPAVGRNVAGAIRYTHPEDCLPADA